jgi:hypothetical protein
MDVNQAVIDVVNGVAIYADLREWSQLRELYSDEVAIDYTSLIGGVPAQVKADDLIAGWKTGLGRYQSTQHLLGNHRVTLQGDTARALVYVQATHWLPQPNGESTWTVHGYYDYTLEHIEGRWCITRHVFTATMVYGNRDLFEMQGVKATWLPAPSNG